MTDGEGSNDEVLSEGKIASSFLLAMTGRKSAMTGE
jgi:hypothetical protein